MLQDIGAVFDLARIHVLTSYGSPADLNLLIFRSFPLILASKAIAGLSTRTGGNREDVLQESSTAYRVVFRSAPFREPAGLCEGPDELRASSTRLW